VQLGDKAGASRSSPAPTRRRHHCEDTEVQPDDEAGASRSKSGTDPPLQDAAGPTTPKSCVEPES